MAAIAFATSLSNTVFPVLGWATIIPLCPFPIGENKSITLVEIDSWLCPVKLNFSDGNKGVKDSKGTLSLMYSGSLPLILSTSTNGKYLSPNLGGLTIPFMVSPVLSPKNLT